MCYVFDVRPCPITQHGGSSGVKQQAKSFSPIYFESSLMDNLEIDAPLLDCKEFVFYDG